MDEDMKKTREDRKPQEKHQRIVDQSKNNRREEIVYKWIMEKRELELVASTVQVIEKGLPINPQFKNGNQVFRILWIFRSAESYYSSKWFQTP